MPEWRSYLGWVHDSQNCLIQPQLSDSKIWNWVSCYQGIVESSNQSSQLPYLLCLQLSNMAFSTLRNIASPALLEQKLFAIGLLQPCIWMHGSLARPRTEKTTFAPLTQCWTECIHGVHPCCWAFSDMWGTSFVQGLHYEYKPGRKCAHKQWKSPSSLYPCKLHN